LATLRGWDIAGRFSIRTKKDAWTGKLYWHQSISDFDIRFSAPTGQGAVQLSSDPQFGVKMQSADGKTAYAEDAETLLYNHTGWELPVSNLRMWVMGLPAEDKVSRIEFDPQGRVNEMVEGAWRIQYKGYQDVGEMSLPRRVFLVNDDLDIRLVVDRWEVNS
jgi:outer membrane lipoprotein LolB